MTNVLRPGEEKLFEGQPRGFPFGDFDVMDVMLPEGDDMDIPSDDEEEEEEVQTESGFGNIIGKDPVQYLILEHLVCLLHPANSSHPCT